LSWKEAAKIFNKEYNSTTDIVNNLWKNINSDNIWWIIILWLFWISFIPFWIIIVWIVW
jgi:hypothetical protein